MGPVEFKAVRGRLPVREAYVDIPVKALGKTVAAKILIVTGTKYVGKVVEHYETPGLIRPLRDRTMSALPDLGQSFNGVQGIVSKGRQTV